MLENSLFAVEQSDWKRVVPLLGAAVVAVAGIGYAVYEHNNAQTLAWQNQQVAAQLDQTHKQLDATSSELSSLSAKVDALAKPSPAVAAAGSGGTAASRTASGAGSSPGRRQMALRDSRYTKMQSQLDAQGKAIDDTRTDLASARTELSGSIAKTHDELVLLEKKGERSYFEFDLNKSKQFAHTGPLSISLRKANEKRGYADLQLIVDDRTLTQKHVNLYQPTMFYEPDSPQPLEIVINGISKDHIHGYISTSKYWKSELTAMANPAPAPGDQASADAQPPTRKRLTVPKGDPNE